MIREEALAISDGISVMKLGIIQQIWKPRTSMQGPTMHLYPPLSAISNLFFRNHKKAGACRPLCLREADYHVGDGRTLWTR